MTGRPTIEFTTCNSNGDMITHNLPAQFSICPLCHGIGKTGQDYAITCDECKGERVVAVVDRKRANYETPNVLDLYDAWLDSRMGA